MGFLQYLAENWSIDFFTLFIILFFILSLPIYHIFLKPIEIKRRQEYEDRINKINKISQLEARISELEKEVGNN